jgi:N-acetylneuraminic acid mutarotase
MLLVDSNKAVTCLGTPTTSLDGDMWEYDISSNSWTDLDTPDPEPTSRFLYSMAYNPDNNKIYLFGGSDSSGTGGNETWEYDVASNVWTQLNPTSPPSARMGHTMAYVGNGIIILFGGESTQSSATQMNDFWVYKIASNTWTMYGLDNDPPVRAAHKWAYIPESNKLIMFSGYNYDGAAYNYMTDTWELSVIVE